MSILTGIVILREKLYFPVFLLLSFINLTVLIFISPCVSCLEILVLSLLRLRMMPQSDLFEGCLSVDDVSVTLEPLKVPAMSFELWIGKQRVKRYLVPADELNAMCFYFGLLLDQFISGYAEKDLRKRKSLVVRFSDYKFDK